MKITLPWSVVFIRRLCRHMSLASALRIRRVVLRAKKGLARTDLVPIRLKDPFRAQVWLRERGTDLGTFDEVVINGIYSTLLQRAGCCAYALDLGGNIGLTSLLLAGSYPRCRILTVEPSPANLAVLTKNLSHLVATGRCQVLAGAAWGEDTTVDLGPIPEEIGFDAIQVSVGDASALRHPVPAYSVATLMRKGGFPRVDILKVDIEGAEAEVFRGPASWLARVNAIAIEFHGDSRQRSGFDALVGAAGFIVEDDRFPNCVIAYRRPGQWVE